MPILTAVEMDSYEDILNLETVDIFGFISGNVKPPAFIDNAMMARLQVKREKVSSKHDGHEEHVNAGGDNVWAAPRGTYIQEPLSAETGPKDGNNNNTTSPMLGTEYVLML